MSAALQTANLDEKALAFIVAGTPTPAVERTSVAAPAAKPPSEATAPPTVERPVPAAPARKATRPKAAPLPEPERLVSVTFRVPASLPARLIRASAERKIQRLGPWSQQEIVAAALDDWLGRHGYEDAPGKRLGSDPED